MAYRQPPVVYVIGEGRLGAIGAREVDALANSLSDPSWVRSIGSAQQNMTQQNPEEARWMQSTSSKEKAGLRKPAASLAMPERDAASRDQGFMAPVALV
jgi:hypothetical protein